MNSSYKTTLASLLSIIFIDSFSYFLIIPILLRLISSNDFLHLSPATRNLAFGFIIGVLQLAYLLFSPIVGRCSDFYGRKMVLSSCLIIAGMGFLLTAVGISLQNLSVILLARVLGGIGASSQPIAWAAIVDISTKDNKTFHLSLVAIAMTLAMMLGPLLGAYLSNNQLSKNFDNQLPFMMATIFIGISLYLLHISFREKNSANTIYLNTETRKCKFSDILNWSQSKSIYYLLLTFFIYEFAWSLYFQDIPIFLQSTYHYSPEQSAQFCAWESVWMLIGLSGLYSILLRYLTMDQILKICFSIIAICAFGSVNTSNIWMQWMMAAPLAMAVGIAYPSLLAKISNMITANAQGVAMGLAATMLALAWTLSAFSIGLWNNFSFAMPLMITSITGFLALVIFSL